MFHGLGRRKFDGKRYAIESGEQIPERALAGVLEDLGTRTSQEQLARMDRGQGLESQQLFPPNLQRLSTGDDPLCPTSRGLPLLQQVANHRRDLLGVIEDHAHRWTQRQGASQQGHGISRPQGDLQFLRDGAEHPILVMGDRQVHPEHAPRPSHTPKCRRRQCGLSHTSGTVNGHDGSLVSEVRGELREHGRSAHQFCSLGRGTRDVIGLLNIARLESK